MLLESDCLPAPHVRRRRDDGKRETSSSLFVSDALDMKAENLNLNGREENRRRYSTKSMGLPVYARRMMMGPTSLVYPRHPSRRTNHQPVAHPRMLHVSLAKRKYRPSEGICKTVGERWWWWWLGTLGTGKHFMCLMSLTGFHRLDLYQFIYGECKAYARPVLPACRRTGYMQCKPATNNNNNKTNLHGRRHQHHQRRRPQPRPARYNDVVETRLRTL